MIQSNSSNTLEDRIENWTGKTILITTPHPDDDTFSSAGTMALLAKNNNDIHIVVLTSGNAGSNDPDMTRDRLASIRKSEEIEACRILGIPTENVNWLGYDDGMLEYADPRKLTKQVVREIRRIQPDAVFSPDPGLSYQQWHKSDHRSTAIITADAIRAAAWRLYFQELEEEGLKHWIVSTGFFYFSTQPNYTVDITDVAELKARAVAAHISQVGGMEDKYDPANIIELREKIVQKLLKTKYSPKNENNRVVEEFRRWER